MGVAVKSVVMLRRPGAFGIHMSLNVHAHYNCLHVFFLALQFVNLLNFS